MEVPSTGSVLDVLVALARTAGLPVSYPLPPSKPAAVSAPAAGLPAANAAAAGTAGAAEPKPAERGPADAPAPVSTEVAQGPVSTEVAQGPLASALGGQHPRVEEVLSCAKVGKVAQRRVSVGACCVSWSAHTCVSEVVRRRVSMGTCCVSWSAHTCVST